VTSEHINVDIVYVIMVHRVPIRDFCQQGTRIFGQRVENQSVYKEANDLKIRTGKSVGKDYDVAGEEDCVIRKLFRTEQIALQLVWAATQRRSPWLISTNRIVDFDIVHFPLYIS